MSKQLSKSWLIHLEERPLARLRPVLYGAIPGHLYSFLACAISPLLKRVRWPIAGRMPLSSREGRIVSRNIPLKKTRSKPHISRPIKAHLLLKSIRVFFKLMSFKGEIHQCWALNSVPDFRNIFIKVEKYCALNMYAEPKVSDDIHSFLRSVYWTISEI